MQMLKCKEIVEATNGKLVSGNMETVFAGICTDSRKINKGDIFIPIIGSNFDGHDFIDAALQGGALGTVTDRDIYVSGDAVVIKVENTTRALGDIAAYYRQKFHIPFVGITGSVGKTSTKDMVASVLEQKFNVLKTEGNFNNEIGLPLTLLKLESYHEAGVIEMGMSNFGEISRLSSITRPDIVIITNIGMSHIEKLGSRQNILKAKMEIFDGLNKNGLVILNGDDNLLYGLKGLLPFRTVFYGMDEGMDYHAYNIETAGEKGTRFRITIGNDDCEVFVPVPGVHNVYNALAAIAAGVELKVPVDKIIKGIEAFVPGKMRLNIISSRGMKIINDVYNASPHSMKAAIDVLKEISGDSRKIAVLGDMLEMGEWASDAHAEVGEYAFLSNIDYIITVGENAKNIATGSINAGMKPDRIFSFRNNKESISFLKGFVKPGDTILVKGSRGMKMEEIVESLLE
ncbi:MAG TPA: UDP-N-acetylmuramoyl-tripeptide--D-alanyl-D-alanine ligase [Clostridiaceae bacterium]|nr:UDP-N-acetylmuramoyl-tripeptide--D-alanyl-D-alanine ligase [Clostridiaceae bacterium]